MKKTMIRILAALLALLFCMPAALADDAVTVVAVNATINGEQAVIVSAGTKLTAIADPAKGTPSDWRVNGVSQGTTDMWLIVTADATTVIEAVYDNGSASAPAPTATAAPAPRPAGKIVTAVNCSLQYLNERETKGEGTAYTELDFTGKSTFGFAVTAVVPKGKKIDYWVIDGAKYVFSSTVKSIIVTEATEGMSFEVVYKNGEPTTLHTEAESAAVTGRRTVSTIHAKLCFMKPSGKGAGGWLETFDFTDDYTNYATEERVPGGWITCKVKATVPGSKKVNAWKFNNAKFKFNVQVTWFNVKELDHTMVYEPLFGKVQAVVTEPPKEPVYYTVTCSGCSFSGGGYTKARSGKVRAGTKITVTSDSISIGLLWRGSRYEGEHPYGCSTTSFTYTVNKNSSFSCHQLIN